jgi:hypothetical protein
MAVLASAIWRVRPSGNNANGGGYDPGIGGAATDYSRQNAAQATGTNGAGSATTTFTDATAAAFTSAMVGNAINISGQGVYFVTAFIGATQVTVDRALGTFSGATWRLGGGWADFYTNTTVAAAILVPGNSVFILGTGTPNPSSYVFDYTVPSGGYAPALGDSTNGYITYANDPDTPGYKAPPDTTGGMPCIQGGIIFGKSGGEAKNNKFLGLYIVNSGVDGGNVGAFFNGSSSLWCGVIGCVYDQKGNGGGLTQAGGSSVWLSGCEAFNSVGGSASGTTNNNFIIATSLQVVGCNIHDCRAVDTAVFMNTGGINCPAIINCIVAKNQNIGIKAGAGGSSGTVLIANNTIDGNGGDGLWLRDDPTLNGAIVLNNIITNHTGVGKFGITMNSTSGAGIDDRNKAFVDYNTFYNNTANTNGITLSPHDTALGVTPYVASSTENYALA